MPKKIVIHLYSLSTESAMPDYLRSEYKNQGLAGARCGYMRKNTVDYYFRHKVTCTRCKKYISD